MHFVYLYSAENDELINQKIRNMEMTWIDTLIIIWLVICVGGVYYYGRLTHRWYRNHPRCPRCKSRKTSRIEGFDKYYVCDDCNKLFEI